MFTNLLDLYIRFEFVTDITKRSHVRKFLLNTDVCVFIWQTANTFTISMKQNHSYFDSAARRDT